MSGLPRSLRRQTILAIVCGVVALFAAVRFLDSLFWTELLKQRGGYIRTTENGEVYLVYLNSPEFGDRDVAIVTGISTLKWLQLKESRITDRALASISRVETLEELDLTGTAITDAGMQQLSGLQRLKVLKLNDCANLTVIGLLTLRDLPRLQTVEIGGIDVSYEDLRRLQANLPVSIRNLDAEAVCGIHDPDNRVSAVWSDVDPPGITLFCSFTVTREWLNGLDSPEAVTGLSMDSQTVDAVEALPLLRRLQSLDAAGLDDRSIAVLTRCRGLSSLELQDSSISDAGLNDLTRLEHLQHLAVASPKIRGESFVGLQNLHELQSLTLICPNADPDSVIAGLAPLAQLSHLESLRLEMPITIAGALVPFRECSLLSHLGLSNCGLTDESFGELGSFPQVEWLDLAGNPLTAACVETLAEWPSLTFVLLDERIRSTIPREAIDGRIRIR